MEEEEHEVDCPICLDPMTEADHMHPMQCSSKKCCFNFCMTCIESLITSSKDDYIEASDGNRHVKVFLNCPNCRSDLGDSIRDTLLLRKVDYILLNPDLGDEDLTPSQLRMKNVIDTQDVREAIVTSRKIEENFFAKLLLENEKEEESDDDGREFSIDYEGWGVEADVRTGVHRSFHLPMYMQPKNEHAIDKSFLGGLEASMSKDEQKYVTKLMTSGDTAKLAEAARILAVISNSNRRGDPLSYRMQKRSSVYALIADCEKARSGATVKEQSILTKALAAVRQEQEYMKLHQLPVRMPKHVTINLTEKEHRPMVARIFKWDRTLPFGFCDDKWDGTVMDAFCKITFNPLTGMISKKRPPNDHQGVLNVLGKGHIVKDLGDARIDVEHNRVVVEWVIGEAAKQGVMKGDVVTHLNGEEFKGSAADLVLDIQESADWHNNYLMLVLNAERSVAEALSRRAMCVQRDDLAQLLYH